MHRGALRYARGMRKATLWLALVVFAALATAWGCSAAREAAAKRGADPSLVLLDAQKACTLYELAPDAQRDPRVDAMCARLRGDCGPSGTGGSP